MTHRKSKNTAYITLPSKTDWLLNREFLDKFGVKVIDNRSSEQKISKPFKITAGSALKHVSGMVAKIRVVRLVSAGSIISRYELVVTNDGADPKKFQACFYDFLEEINKIYTSIKSSK